MGFIVIIMIGAWVLNAGINTIVYITIARTCSPEDRHRIPWNWRIMFSLPMWVGWLRMKGYLG